MAELDHSACVELIVELVQTDGDLEFSHAWCSRGPGAGADTERVYSWHDLYWRLDSTLGLLGPFNNLADAIGDLALITDATTEIYCLDLNNSELMSMLEVSSHRPGQVIKINGEQFLIDESRVFTVVDDPDDDS